MNNNGYNKVNFKRIDVYYKILLIGPRRVGKSQILKRICQEGFNENYSPSFGLDFRIQKFYSENLIIQIMEIADRNEIAEEILKEYIIDADCFICIYDITNINSVRELIDLVKYYEGFIPPDNKKQCWYFVGNKSDDKNRECTNRPENLFSYVPYGNIGFIEISAKENKNKSIDTMFRSAIMRIKELRKNSNEDKNKEKDKFDYKSKGRNSKNNNTNKFNDDNGNSSRKLNDNNNMDDFKYLDDNFDKMINNKKDKTKDIKEENKKCDIF